VDHRLNLFFAAGNGILYSFDVTKNSTEFPPVENSKPRPPAFQDSYAILQTNLVELTPPPMLLRHIFTFDFDPSAPKHDVHRYNSNRREGPCDFYAMPVFYRNRIYLAGGGDLWWGKNEAWLKCVDATKTGDVTTNALLWSYALQKHVMSTPAISNDLLFIADCGRMFHCLDAETGKPIWTHDIKGEAWASPLVADGKVYLGTRSGNFYIFAAQKEKTLLSEIELGEPVSATTMAANRALYVATMSRLYALKNDSK
jgi:outer membrane protein assembly factor BamB